MNHHSREVLAEALEHIGVVADKLTLAQEKAITKSIEKSEKTINRRIDEGIKRLTERTIEDIKDRLSIVHNSEKVHKDLLELKRLTESLIEKHAFVTELSYLGRMRLNHKDQARLNEELIKSMDFPNDWFHKRNKLSLNELFEMYQNGVKLDNEDD